MKLIQAKIVDFERLTLFYRYVIDHTENMDIYGRWIYGLHPTDELIRKYILSGSMYYCEEGGSINAAVAVVPSQGEDYHDIEWSLSLEDNEVATIHILCVNPKVQKQGVAREVMEQIINHVRSIDKKAVRLDALSCNIPAQHLYESLGFECRGKQKWYACNVGWTDFLLYELKVKEWKGDLCISQMKI